MKFDIILADCPWEFSDLLEQSDTPRGAAANYPLLNTDELCKLKVNELADPEGCVLALWAVGSMLDDAIRVMKSWGFKQKQIFVWVKTKQQPLQSLKKNLRKNKKLTGAQLIENFGKDVDSADLNDTLAFGMGRLFRQTHEICLIGINNTKIYKKIKDKSQRSVSVQPATKHSKKPEDLQDRLDKMFPGDLNRLELFSRRDRPGWFCAGNDCPSTKGEDIRDSIERLIADVKGTTIKQ